MCLHGGVGQKPKQTGVVRVPNTDHPHLEGKKSKTKMSKGNGIELPKKYNELASDFNGLRSR